MDQTNMNQINIGEIIPNYNIFVKHKNKKTGENQILTYTNIREIIPNDSLSYPIKNWQKYYSKEWRWRIIKIGNKKIVEISYKIYNNDNRIYFDKCGNWKENMDTDLFSEYEIEIYYYYTKCTLWEWLFDDY
jgi:hypothetical protein